MAENQYLFLFFQLTILHNILNVKSEYKYLFVNSFWLKKLSAGKSSLQETPLCLVINLKPSTPMLYTSLALAHLSNLLITQYFA